MVIMFQMLLSMVNRPYFMLCGDIQRTGSILAPPICERREVRGGLRIQRDEEM